MPRQSEAHSVEKKISSDHGRDVAPCISTPKWVLSSLGRFPQVKTNRHASLRKKIPTFDEIATSTGRNAEVTTLANTSKRLMIRIHEKKSPVR